MRFEPSLDIEENMWLLILVVICVVAAAYLLLSRRNKDKARLATLTFVTFVVRSSVSVTRKITLLRDKRK
jgi:ABC-type iron transport system FetAB permease component